MNIKGPAAPRLRSISAAVAGCARRRRGRPPKVLGRSSLPGKHFPLELEWPRRRFCFYLGFFSPFVFNLSYRHGVCTAAATAVATIVNFSLRLDYYFYSATGLERSKISTRIQCITKCIIVHIPYLDFSFWVWNRSRKGTACVSPPTKRFTTQILLHKGALRRTLGRCRYTELKLSET